MLLQEYVCLLMEDDGGDVAADLMSGATDAMPYGMTYGSGSDLYKVFVEPFVDVFKVASGKTKELSIKAQTLGKTAFKAVMASVIPGIADDYERIFAQERKRLEKIRREHQDAYDRVWKAFAHDDVKVLAFFCDPLAAGAMLAYFGGKGAVKTALDAVNSLSGGALDHLLVRGKGQGVKADIAQGVGGDVDEGVIREALDKKALGKAVKAALETDDAQSLVKAARATVRSTLQAVQSKAKSIASAKTLQDVQKAGIDVPEAAMKAFASLPDDERGSLEARMLSGMKRSAIEFYVKNLEGQVKHAVEAGVPKQSAYVKEYEGAINAIRGMA